MTAAETLVRVLDRLEEDGGSATFWWRDDDLEDPSDRLSDLLSATGDAGIEPAIAAISGTVRETAIAGLGSRSCAILPHGWHHTNHAPPEDKKSEFGTHRPLEARLEDVRAAHSRLLDLAGARYLPCFVPPWNRIGSDLIDHLPDVGISALSTFQSRLVSGSPIPEKAGQPKRSPARLDTHVDLIDWRSGKVPKDADTVARQLAALLEGQGGVRIGPIGILSHHLVTDAPTWRSWTPLWSLLSDHAASRWVSPQDALCMVTDGAAKRHTAKDVNEPG